MEADYLADLFPGVDSGELSLPYFFFRKLERANVPELERRRAPNAPGPKHQCARLPMTGESKIVGSLPLHGPRQAPEV